MIADDFKKVNNLNERDAKNQEKPQRNWSVMSGKEIAQLRREQKEYEASLATGLHGDGLFKPRGYGDYDGFGYGF